jgi:hypothetical protein
LKDEGELVFFGQRGLLQFLGFLRDLLLGKFACIGDGEPFA